MEALERYSGELRDDVLARRMVDDMLSSDNAIDPRSLILPQRTMVHIMSQPVAWVKGQDMIENEEVWVPASAAFHPYSSPKDLALFRTNTNGLASGNTMEEAVVHGLCELIERDAWSICESKHRVIGDILPPTEIRLIQQMLDKFSSNGIEVRLKDLTSDVGLPTFAATADDVRLQDPALLCLGMGTHLSPKITVIRALTEVAQSRLTQIHGAREDTVRGKASRQMGYERIKRMNQMWFADSKKGKELAEYQSFDTADLYDDLQIIISCLQKRGFKRVIAVDLTRKELDIPVVKMIVPGMEVYAMDEERAGARLRREAS